MGNFRQITPFMHVPDLEAAISFFRELLGFQLHARMTDYAYLHRETAGIRILQNHGSDGAPPGNRRFAYYVDVHDVDALHAELKPRLDRLPEGDVHGPADKPYGQRELAVVAPDGNLIVFGHDIAEAAEGIERGHQQRRLSPSRSSGRLGAPPPAPCSAPPRRG